MEYVKFSIRIPKTTVDAIDTEASIEHRNRNQQIEKILTERYKAHAPPTKSAHVATNGKANTQRASSRK